jgi:hypothetical protein
MIRLMAEDVAALVSLLAFCGMISVWAMALS